MPKRPAEPARIEPLKVSMGPSPALLAKRKLVKPHQWCPKIPIDFDILCDPDNPRIITYRDVLKAQPIIKETITDSLLLRSRRSKHLEMNLYFKLENFHRTGSFNERSALYSLSMLNEEQRHAGVITASLGNFAKALAYHGQRLNINVTVVLPTDTPENIVDECEEFGADVVLHGYDLEESKRQAFVLLAQNGNIYINGYDHPHVIAGSGTIGLEILEELPETDVILVPVGGGGLIAGIAAIVKHLKPTVLIYGVEPDKCCSFYKALQNHRPYRTELTGSVAGSLEVPLVGYNAYHTARSLVDKMVLVKDDCIIRGMSDLMEYENFVAEGAGATSLGALLATPNLLPELKGKTVVCLITGGNMNYFSAIPLCLERARATEGRLMKLTIKQSADDDNIPLLKRILTVIAHVGCNVVNCEIDRPWLIEDNLETYFSITCETCSFEHACTLKRILEYLFPGVCEFEKEPFMPIPICFCFPKRRF